MIEERAEDQYASSKVSKAMTVPGLKAGIIFL